jgi:exopolyphosphatase/guanosine-5'-triphosphate,3'-diphosphate pyrophosphatase
LKFAAIDIGSNAIRLLFSIVTESKGNPHFHKASLIRMPVRLGSDSFVRGEISEARKQDLIKTLHAYRQLIEVYGVESYMACATSALREAANGAEIVKEIKEKTGLDILLIDGKLEAELIYATHIAEDLHQHKSYLYIDVGGGSTELTLFHLAQRTASESFRIGTIRLLEGLVKQEEWQRMQSWIHEHTDGLPDLSAIGTGGNINKLFKLSGRKEGKPMFQNTLSYYTRYLSSFSFEERVDELGMRPDRADVIIPATEIYYQILKWAKIHEIFVPKVGLADGMIHMLYEKHTGIADLSY